MGRARDHGPAYTPAVGTIVLLLMTVPIVLLGAAFAAYVRWIYALPSQHDCRPPAVPPGPPISYRENVDPPPWTCRTCATRWRWSVAACLGVVLAIGSLCVVVFGLED